MLPGPQDSSPRNRLALDWKPPVRAESRDAKRAGTRCNTNRKHGATPSCPFRRQHMWRVFAIFILALTAWAQQLHPILAVGSPAPNFELPGG